jgi:TP901 family phage tail tape measure protein
MASGKEYSMLFKLNAELGSSFASAFNGAKNPVLNLQTEINKLNKAQSDISAYTKQQGAVDNTRKKLEMLKQQYDNLQKEMAETGDSSAAMKNQLIAKQNQIDRTSSSLQQQTEKLNTMDAALDKAGISTKDLASESKRLDGMMDELKGSQEDAARAADELGNSANETFNSLQSILVGTGIAAGVKQLADGLKASAEAAILFESAMAGVNKTTDLNLTELAAMADEFQHMSTVIPVSANDLASIAETAGQLGVAKSNIADFTAVMAKLSTSTTMAAQEGATLLAQFANITQMDPANYERLASATVDLGNNFATTEQKIIDMSQGMAASADLAGMSEADILGLSAAVSSLGIEAQAGSTSAARLISELDKAVDTGKGLEDFARIAGLSAKDFSRAWGEDAAEALVKFITGLNDVERNGKSATVILEELGITEVRMQRMMLSLAGSGDLMNRALETSNQAWQDNTALQDEANKRYGTTQSKIDMAKNAFENLKVTLGEHLTPIIGAVADKFNEIVTNITNWMDKNPELTAAILTGVGIFAIGAAGIGIYTAAVNAAKIALGLMQAAIPGVGWVLGGIAAAGVLAGAYVYLKNKADNAGDSFPNLDRKFDESMKVISANQKIIDLGTEYFNLSEKVGGGQTAIKNYAEEQSRLWESWKSGNIPTGEYNTKLESVRTQYYDNMTRTDEYKEKEEELWRALARGDIPIPEYVDQIDKVRAEYGDVQKALEKYKEQETLLWAAYTGGDMPIGEYEKALKLLRDEYGFNDVSAEELAATEAKLAQVKGELRTASGGLITATDEETEAFNRQVKALMSIAELAQTNARKDAYDALSKMSKDYAKSLETEQENTEYLVKAQQKRAEVEGLMGGGYDNAIAKANELADAMVAVWSDDSLTSDQQEERFNALTKEASQLMQVLSGDPTKDYGGNANAFFRDLENMDTASAKFGESWQKANDEVAKYQGVISEAQGTQDIFLQNLVDGVVRGGFTLEQYETLLAEKFAGYENGAEIVANIMTYVEQATRTAANVEGMGNNMATTEEQALALQDTITAAKVKVDELATAYTTVYNSALQSINGQIKLFEELKDPEKKLTSDQMLKTLNEQAAYLDAYTANIRKATELGVAPELVKQLSDGSVESAAYLQTIVNSGNEKITELNTAFGKVSEGKETFATTLADIQTNFTTKMTEIQTQLAADITAMNLNAEAAQSGKNTIQGFIDGANGMLKPVKDAYAAIAAAAAAALKIELGIESPSKVTQELGMYTGMGLIKGAEAQTEKFSATMRDLAKAGVDGYQTGNILDVLGPGAFEQNGKIYVSAQQSTLTARSSSPAGGTISIKVSPVYHITGNDKPEAVRSVLQQHSGELRDLVLDIVADADFDSRRRGYDV